MVTITTNDIIYVIINGIIILGLAYFTNLKVYGKSYVEKMRDPRIPAKRLRKDIKEHFGMEITSIQSRRLSYMIMSNIKSSISTFYNGSKSTAKSYEYYSEGANKSGNANKDLKVLIRAKVSDEGVITVDIMNIDSLKNGGIVRYKFEYFTVYNLQKD